MVFKLLNIITIEFFSFFSEYFFIIILGYILFVGVMITCNVYGLLIQKAFSECSVLFLLMHFYLLFNEHVFYYNFLNFSNFFINDYFSAAVKIFIVFCSAIYFLIISDNLKKQKIIAIEYILIVLFCILGLLLLCNCSDLLTAYLVIELSSLGFYILAAFKKISVYSLASGLKYFIVGAMSSAFFLLGSSFFYGFTGSINLFDFQNLLNYSSFYFNFYEKQFFNSLEIGFILILFSLFIKIGAAPFHVYLLDIYEGSPTTSTFFFAFLTKLSVFVFLTRLCYQSFFNLKSCWQYYLLVIGSFSVFVGAFGGLKQRKIKTLLAYSSTAHMGYILIAFSSTTFIGIQMLFFYLFVYSISNAIVWYIVLLLVLKNFKHKFNLELIDLALLTKSNSVLALFLSICMLSISGMPPFLGFLAKMSLFLSIIGISFYFASLIVIFCSVVSTFYYIRIIKILYFENCLIGKLYCPIKTAKTLILSVFVALLFYFFINPNLIYLVNYKIVLFL